MVQSAAGKKQSGGSGSMLVCLVFALWVAFGGQNYMTYLPVAMACICAYGLVVTEFGTMPSLCMMAVACSFEHGRGLHVHHSMQVLILTCRSHFWYSVCSEIGACPQLTLHLS